MRGHRFCTTLGVSGGYVPEWRKHLQPCEYLETDGNSWIQLDYYCGSNIAIQITVKDFATLEGAIFGNQSDNAYCIFKPAEITTIRCDYNGLGPVSVIVGNNVTFTILYNIIESTKHKVNVYKNRNLTELVGSANLNGNTFQARKNIVFFNAYKGNNANTLDRPMGNGEKICNDIHVYYNDTLETLHRYYTCYVKMGQTYTDNKGNVCPAGTPGMYDVVNNTFYTNDGSGQFTHGEDINL